MNGLLIDSNILLDLFTQDPKWYPVSAALLETAVERLVPIINPIIYAEVSIRFETIEALEDALPKELFRREELPWEAGFLAGKCFLRYRRRGGARSSPLPDFYIGAHAAVRGHAVLTRDPTRYRGYFPTVEVIGP
ncbi:MAG: type II toxin-antitoxin system VapC family toxin [Acidobacteria bacterium]|nr:type II toxin-antitoxin system VapC family toxin [Acidobacteriota bacterium]